MLRNMYLVSVASSTESVLKKLSKKLLLISREVRERERCLLFC